VRGKGSSSSGSVAEALSSADDAVFQGLRAWRKELADADGVPAFVILSDRSLREIATDRPRDVASLLRVNGIGQVKADRFGAAILEVLRSGGWA
jgi:ATP-dependent DNA helicase RecQ